MAQKNLESYKWVSMTAERRIGDSAWQFSIEFTGETIPSVYTDLYYVPPGETYPIMLCHLVSARKEYGPSGSCKSSAVGYSMGWYLKEEIDPNQRNSIVSGTTTLTYENPTAYLKRLLWTPENPAHPETNPAADTTKPLRGLTWPGVATFGAVKNWGIRSAGVSGYTSGYPLVSARQFSFDTESMTAAIDQIAEHCHMILLDEFGISGTTYINRVHWVPEASIPTATSTTAFAGVPATLNFNTTSTTATLNGHDMIGNPGKTVDLNSEDKKNCCRVELLQSKLNESTNETVETWYVKEYKPATAIPQRWLVFRSADKLDSDLTATQCNAVAADILVDLTAFIAIAETTIDVWFKDRYDFRLYQGLTFTGFAGITADVLYRVVGIRYECNPPDSGGNRVCITISQANQWVLSRKYKLYMDDIQSEAAQVEKIVYAQLKSIQSGTITYVDPDGAYALATSDVNGLTIKGRSWNQ